MYNPTHKIEFERKFVRYYLMYEIGLETPALFKIFLQNKLNMELPFYNQLYRINDLLSQINLLYDRDIKRDMVGTGENQETNETGHSGTVERDNTQNGTTEIENTTSSLEEQTGTDNGTIQTEYDKLQTNNLSETTDNWKESTQYGKQDTHTDHYQKDNIGQSNGAGSNFPQANVINTNMYYTTGEESNNQMQENMERSLAIKSGGTDTKTTSGTKTNSGTISNKDRTTETRDLDLSKTIKNNGQSSQKNAIENEIKELTKSAENIINNLKNNRKYQDKMHEYGLTGNRSVAQMLQEYKNVWSNVDKMLIEECRDLFMQVY